MGIRRCRNQTTRTTFRGITLFSTYRFRTRIYFALDSPADGGYSGSIRDEIGFKMSRKGDIFGPFSGSIFHEGNRA